MSALGSSNVMTMRETSGFRAQNLLRKKFTNREGGLHTDTGYSHFVVCAQLRLVPATRSWQACLAPGLKQRPVVADQRHLQGT